ncbi:hypothetical protein [Lachnoanaerobaculum saburreum]|uniref:Uncharacterized protein n=1 Tax=Lachnoanaerobaculum saburreum DSM 3986 TaxID=887325 RepID=E6LQD7_9FIRM|nr:hypothetical protein [Lachnoanaerobaculum saburreum]EFU75961.1 hypothetical protein HMPREF0381_2172 [Lachnoanaerobaculum saburreum DSM 3986]
MICEGRILEKFEVRSITVECRMWKILDAMNYHRRVMIGKRDYDIILSKEDSEYDFFDEEDSAPMIQIYAYVDIKEVLTRKSRKQGLVTFFRFPDMIGKELIILEIVHRYMEEYPNTAFYVDNGYTFRKHNIDAIYNNGPDAEWIYRGLIFIKNRE